ncbi:MAG: insulinase family protein [Bacteroidia bacterium]|nr:insulinase family protein [Bacteroidia bacterium]MDW8157554.1 insulinase family protein [Bacteroidia bacterium]
MDLNASLPFNPNVKKGKLENGLTYFIQKNPFPSQRVELRLVIKAGSILETEEQLGLAHFVEHMAFNGTQNFKKQELISYLESIGTRFGAHLNAYTSFDETVYMLQLPTNKPEVVKKGLLVLEDWAARVSFEPEEIDKERGVIIEEWRGNLGADYRIQNKQFPIFYFNSRYAERLPIGKVEVLQNFPHSTLIQFYKDWYRPDLMGIIVVGDIDPTSIEKEIKERFSKLPPPTNAKERKYYTIPFHPQTLYSIVTDPEADAINLMIAFKFDKIPTGTLSDFRKNLVYSVFEGCLQERIEVHIQDPQSPLGMFYAHIMDMGYQKNALVLYTVLKNSDFQKAYQTLLRELELIKRFGFREEELQRQKKEILRYYESSFKEKDKTESARLAAELVNHFLDQKPYMGPEDNLKYAQALLPTISLEEINQLAQQWIQEQNQVVLASGPEDKKNIFPSEAELRKIAMEIKNEPLVAQSEEEIPKELISTSPTAGKIIAEKKNKELGTIEWKLSNGATVVLKPTSFKEDEVLLAAFSAGGSSLAEDENFISASVAGELMEECGIGKLSNIQLKKYLSGKIAEVSPQIEELKERLSGYASPQDLETLFQLVYLWFVEPRKDSSAFEVFKARNQAALAHRASNPEARFYDTIRIITYNRHFRMLPPSLERLEKVKFTEAYHFFRERFSNAKNFTFILVGNFSPSKIKPYVEKYIASLPAYPGTSHWKNRNINPIKGVKKIKFQKGLAPKSNVYINFHGPTEWTIREHQAVNVLVGVMNIKLREAIREEKAGTYAIQAYLRPQILPNPYYQIQIYFSCDPSKVDELVQTIYQVIDEIKKNGIDPQDLKKVKEQEIKQRETALKKNSFWLGLLENIYFYQLSPKEVLKIPDYIQSLSTQELQEKSNFYFNHQNLIEVILMPENH